MRIAFLGASVTQQSIDHQTDVPTGYTYFAELLLRNAFGEAYSQQVFAYGGNRLSDAGLLRVHEVVAFKPDICVIEPLIEDSTRGESSSVEIISYIYECLLKNNIIPFTFFLPSAYCLEPEQSSAYHSYISLLRTLGLEEFKCVVNLSREESASLLCDAFHTNSNGATKYARELTRSILAIFSSGIVNRERISKALVRISPARMYINTFKDPLKNPIKWANVQA